MEPLLEAADDDPSGSLLPDVVEDGVQGSDEVVASDQTSDELPLSARTTQVPIRLLLLTLNLDV